ncbi:unnamed protein product [Lactuca saligna]|uniref:Transferase n=1 Tax=Lactuca saligna TaxID=75948 RepID=A0AA35ZGS5_LACSI|nr:unnamed protein product [Lactuca saligna]
MASATVRRISECFVKPDLPPDAKQPIYFTPFELIYLNANYSQKGLLFAKPSPPESHHFSITTFLEDLRRSLSATLTHFYPLAARLATRKEENPPSYVIYIDPENSPGVKFAHATVDITVSDILTSTDVTELLDGIFIGGSVNHLIADGTSFWHFMAAWSEIFRSKQQDEYSISRPPIFKKWVLEGSDPVINLPFTHHNQFIDRPDQQAMFQERFFHFSSAIVSRLKAKANAESNTHKISSLQAVSALLWRCITRVRGLTRESETVCKLVISNRCRLNPPLSDDYFGNPIQSVSGTATVEDLMTRGLGWAALQLHEAVANHDDTAVKKWVESWFRSPVVYKRSQLFHPNVVHFGSSPRFDMYGCEFGLGKAVAARSGYMNKADGKMTMYPGQEGGGSMDVEVCLLPEYMMDLECDEEFIIALKSN